MSITTAENVPVFNLACNLRRRQSAPSSRDNQGLQGPNCLLHTPKAHCLAGPVCTKPHTKRIGLSGNDEYAGLCPDAPFFFSTQSGGFSMVSKPRELESGEVGEYLAADGLEHLFRRIFDRCGLKACSSHSGRRTFASTLLANGVSSDDISGLLGHSDIDATGDYLECSEAMLEDAFADVL